MIFTGTEERQLTKAVGREYQDYLTKVGQRRTRKKVESG